MEKRVLGKTGLLVSIIAFGGFLLSNVEADRASKIVEFAIENSINYFDIAPSYGNSQSVLGPALAPFRKYVYLTSKTKERGAVGAKAELLRSLRELKTEYLDNYQLHSVDTMDEVERIFGDGGAMETLRWAFAEGLTKHIGFSAHDDVIAMEMFARADFDTVMFPVNFAYREIKGASVKTLEYTEKHNIGFIATKALAERCWFEGEERTYPRCWYHPISDNENLARIALNYTLTRKGVVTAPSPSDERMLRLAVKIIKSQGGNPVEPDGEDYAYLVNYAKGMNADDLIF